MISLRSHTRLYSSHTLELVDAPDASRESPECWGSVAVRTPQSSWGIAGVGTQGRRWQERRLPRAEGRVICGHRPVSALRRLC